MPVNASTWLGITGHPAHRRAGVGSGLVRLIESKYPNANVYIKALGESKNFYAHLGFKIPRTEMTVMFKKPRRCHELNPPASIDRVDMGLDA